MNKIFYITFFYLLCFSVVSAAITDPALKHAIFGMNYYEKAYESIMTNSVHSNTPGYKATGITSQKNGRLRETIVFHRFIQGTPIKSGGSLDFMIEGKGFFVVQCPWGQSYTRDGRFTLDQNGKLITLTGHFPVLGESGEIYLTNHNISVTEKGVFVLRGESVDFLRIEDFEDTTALKSFNGTIFYPQDENIALRPATNYIIKQGYYESSNVNMIGQLSKFPEVKNVYDANTKSAKMILKSLSAGLQMGSPD